MKKIWNEQTIEGDKRYEKNYVNIVNISNDNLLEWLWSECA